MSGLPRSHAAVTTYPAIDCHAVLTDLMTVCKCVKLRCLTIALFQHVLHEPRDKLRTLSALLTWPMRLTHCILSEAADFSNTAA